MTTQRFENAVKKLYTAFHEGTLEAANCNACAVGNICNNQREWADYIGCGHGKSKVTKQYFDAIVNAEEFVNGIIDHNKGLRVIEKSGYSPFELMNVESIFMRTAIDQENNQTQETQFKGLCAVIEYLAELDGIPNPMAYTKLFETEDNKPKYELVI